MEFNSILESLPQLHFLVINGDMVEGKSPRSGGTELITADMVEQCDMATKIIEHIRTFGHKDMHITATFGTDYHTATQGDDWEQVVKDKAQIDKIGSHEWLDVNGLIFDIKHHIGSSATPYGRHTAISKEALWNELWSLTKQQPRADVIIRSHVHYFQHCGTSKKLAMTLPALQGMGSKFGARKCSGLVDWGAVLFEVEDKNNYEWHPLIRTINTQKAKAIKI